MDDLATLILAGLLADFVIRRTVDALELRHLARRSRGTTAEVRGYLGSRLRLRVALETARLIALLLFWAWGGFRVLDEWLRGWGLLADAPVLRGVVFVGLLAVLGAALGLPFRVYGTFVIEARYGFNRTTPAVFVADLAKGSVLGALVGAPVLAAVFWALDRGPGGLVLVWVGAVAFSLIIQYVGPRWILPLFNRFDSLEEGELRDRLIDYAESVGFAVGDIQIMDASRRTTKGNAFFAGTGSSRRIVLFDTLVERHPVPEVVGVTAHEVGHYRLGHVLRGTALGWVYAAAALALFALLSGEALSRAIGLESTSVYGALVAFSLLIVPLELVGDVVGGFLSRRRERAADSFAARTTGHPLALAAALERLSADVLADPDPHPAYVLLNYSHPPPGPRVDRLRSLAG